MDEGNAIGASMPATNRRVIKSFVDFETGYQVTIEMASTPVGSQLFYRLSDPATGYPVHPAERAKLIDGEEDIVVHSGHGVTSCTGRTIDPATGCELVIERLLDLESGKELKSGRSIAFSENKRETILDRFLKSRAESEETERFWAEAYPAKSLAERKDYWLEFIRRDIRRMGEIGEDELGIFSPDSYRSWAAKDSDIDVILDHVAKELPRFWPEHDAEICRRISKMRD